MNLVLNEEFLGKVSSWRQYIHQHPELSYEEFGTASYVASKLEEFGYEVTTGIGRTGVMATIRGNHPGPIIGIRADMDALPIEECNSTSRSYKSTIKGKMHACGHDGHTAILLGVAEKVSISKNFKGTLVLIFQPAEENGAGALAMLEDPRWNTFGIEKIYGLHNLPHLKLGTFAVIQGPCMASADSFTFELRGAGGHAAYPHLCPDILSAGSTLVLWLSGLSRRICPATEPLVITVTQIHTGTASNIVPAKCMINGTVRCFSNEMRIKAEESLNMLGKSIEESFQLEVELEYNKGYPVNFNHYEQAIDLKNAALSAGMEEIKNEPPSVGSEDFSYFTQALPGAYLFLGSGDEAHNSSVHSCNYDFNDDAIKYGIKMWLSLIQDSGA